MPFSVSEAHLHALFQAANFDLPNDDMVFIGLRGCVPVGSSTAWAASHKLEYVGVDHTHLRCTIVQWRPGSGFAVFPGSTVPYIEAIREGVLRGGGGVNQLALGYFNGHHRYRKGDHSLNDAGRRHRAFRNDQHLPVWRTSDDTDYEGDDRLTYSVAYDNIHCAWQQNAAANRFSSNGCQVIVGRPRVLAKGWEVELGPWADFVKNAYDRPQQRFAYALFSGREVLATAEGVARSQSVRFGSTGELVHVVQDALLKHGYDVGQAGPDGEAGFGTIEAVRLFQRKTFGAGAADLIVGRSTAVALGLNWPEIGAPAPALLRPMVGGVEQPAVAAPPASAGGELEAEGPPAFRSLAGGFFSGDPFDLSKKRSIRTNNPGALNVRPWQRAFPGFVGVTQADRAGNVTSIFVTPEHGVGVWRRLLADRYGYGGGSVSLRELAVRYAGAQRETEPPAQHYLAGWRRWSGGTLKADTHIEVDDDHAMLELARAMFGHEAGSATPLGDDQILLGLELERTNSLPPA